MQKAVDFLIGLYFVFFKSAIIKAREEIRNPQTKDLVVKLLSKKLLNNKAHTTAGMVAIVKLNVV